MQNNKSMKNWPKVSIVVCTHNRRDALEKYLFKAILKIDYPDFEVVIVDDASTDDTEQIVSSYKNKIKNLIYIKNNRQRGLCYVRNLGIKHSSGEIIAFTDDDCYLDKHWIGEITKPFLKNSGIAISGGKIFSRNTQKVISVKDRPYGCNMTFRRNIFRKFIFDTNIYFNRSSWHDETELIKRIKNKGYEISYAPKAKLKHFLLPARYRSYKELGAVLNRDYMETKKTKIGDYYFTYLLLIFLYFKARLAHRDIGRREELCKHEVLYPSEVVGKIFQLWKFGEISTLKAVYSAYLLAFEIPIRAKFKNFREEMMFKFNLGID